MLTIGSLDRIVERSYREACADRLVEIGLYLDNYRGAGCISFPPFSCRYCIAGRHIDLGLGQLGDELGARTQAVLSLDQESGL